MENFKCLSIKCLGVIPHPFLEKNSLNEKCDRPIIFHFRLQHLGSIDVSMIMKLLQTRPNVLLVFSLLRKDKC